MESCNHKLAQKKLNNSYNQNPFDFASFIKTYP